MNPFCTAAAAGLVGTKGVMNPGFDVGLVGLSFSEDFCWACSSWEMFVKDLEC